MRMPRVAVAIVLLAGLALSAESEKGSICIAPVPTDVDGRSAPGLACSSEKLSLKIDEKTIPDAWRPTNTGRGKIVRDYRCHASRETCRWKPSTVLNSHLRYGAHRPQIYSELFSNSPMMPVKKAASSGSEQPARLSIRISRACFNRSGPIRI